MEVQIIRTESKFQGAIVKVRVDELSFSGEPTKREIVVVNDVAAVLAVREAGHDSEVLLVKQYRHAAERCLWEIPAGRIDESENGLDCARRELAEETGYRASDLKRLGGFYSSPGFTTEFINVFLARELNKISAPPDGDEVAINAEWKSVNDVLSAGLLDAKSLAALTLYRRDDTI